MGVALQSLEVRSHEEFEGAFDRAVTERADAVFVLGGSLALIHAIKVTELALRRRLPSMYPYRDFVTFGGHGLMSYGPVSAALTQRAAAYVHRVLRGAKPADLPVERPTELEFIVNLRTAKTLGLTIPLSVLTRADQVIE